MKDHDYYNLSYAKCTKTVSFLLNKQIMIMKRKLEKDSLRFQMDPG